MRIQHNILAMNAYRNYNNNTSALGKNLEKLSSGYKINRAGDDAAGLAISEKMRAQITGLNAAQKNVKDGISLVKTAEGAMQEIQDMLNRMDYLATQSANGTYDDETDRAALQKEVNQLKDEIDRIADSANFNGIKLLDGSLDETRQASTETIFSGLKGSTNVKGDVVATGAASGFGGPDSKGGLKLTGVDLATGAGTSHEASDNSVRYHKDAAVAGKTTFTVDLDGCDYESASAGTSINGLIFGLRSGETAAPSSSISGSEAMTGNVLYLDDKGETRVTYDVTADNNGITSENIASSIMSAIEKNGGKVYIQAGDNGSQKFIEYNVTQDGDKLIFTMSDDGYNKAVEADDAKTGDDNYFQGNFSFAVNYKGTGASNTAAATQSDMIVSDSTTASVQTELAFTNAVVSRQQHEHTSNVNEGTSPAGTIYAEATIRFDGAGTTVGMNKVGDVIKDGAGLQLGDEYYIFAGSDEVFNGEYANNVKVVDIRDLDKLGTTDAGSLDDLRLALDRLSQAASGNEMFNVQVAHGGTAITVTERSTYTGDANLTMIDRGLESQIRTFDSATSKTTVTKEAGKALNLQIGDTSESYNQMKVKIGDMHTTALGVAGLDISNAESAAAAIDTIKAAINQVSSVRGDLGAYQNRLEHTQNNLSVMAENIQDAESTIRDTDVAEEMMGYVKNNILLQSAQAMLAQANQVPQGVLQLLG